MKRLIQILFLTLFVLVFSVQTLFAKIPTAKLDIKTQLDILQNNEVIEITGQNFAANDNILAVILITENEDLSVDYKVIREFDLKVDHDGKLTGNVTITGIDRSDRFGQILVSSYYSNVIPTNKLKVYGKLTENSMDKLLASGFTFTEESGDNIAQLNEQFDIDDGGSGWVGNVLSCIRREWDNDQEPDPVIVASVGLSPTNLNITDGQLGGYTNNGSTAYQASTDSIDLGVMDGSFAFTFSDDGYTTIDNVRPNLDSAYAFALDTIRLFFDEPVLEVGGDAAGKFILTSPVSSVSISPVGGEPSAIWDLEISGLSDRGLGGLKIVYDSSVETNELQDPFGNEVMTTGIDSIVVTDGIPPDNPTLRNSSNDANLTIGEFLGSSSYSLFARVKAGGDDSSLDGVLFEGSDNGSIWTPIGTAGTVEPGDSADFTVTWNIGTIGKFKILRARAFDDAGANGANNQLDDDDNSTESVIIGSVIDGFNDNFKDTYQAIIEKVEPASIGQSSGSIRAAIIVELQNNYGDSINTLPSSVTLIVSESTTTTEKWWGVASGGTGVDDSRNLTIITTAGEDTVWYSNSESGGPNTLVLTESGNDFATNNGRVSANGQTITVTVSNIVIVSNHSPAVNSNIDTTTTAGDLNVQVDVDGEEDGDVGDDFRFVWGFSNSTTPGSYNDTTRSGNLTPPVGGGQISYPIPPADLRDQGAQYIYMYYWLENISTDPNATILDGFPISSNPARLVCNPHLVTTAGENGADAAQGSFTPGENYQEVVSIKFMSNPILAKIQITSIVFDITATSTVDVNDLGTFRLFKDGGVKGTYESLLDQEIASVDYESGTAVNFQGISPVLEVTGTNGAHVLVTIDIKSGANSDHTLGMRLQATDRITMVDNVENGPRTAITKDAFSPLGTSIDYPLPVTLSTFTATAGYGKIILSWVTTSEINNAGFYVMRAAEETGIYNQMNNQIIQGYGNTTMEHHYRYVDTNVEIGKTYYYKLYSQDFNGDIFQYPVVESIAALAIPETFALQQNFPNPFNPTTKITFSVPEEADVKLEIYNMLGQKIRTLVDGQYEAGVYEDVVWDATDNNGNLVANGIYYLVLVSKEQDFKQVRKMVFMK